MHATAEPLVEVSSAATLNLNPQVGAESIDLRILVGYRIATQANACYGLATTTAAFCICDVMGHGVLAALPQSLEREQKRVNRSPFRFAPAWQPPSFAAF